jgi:hypothetical protein
MRRLVLLASAALLPACATRSELRSMPSDAGIAKTYTATFDKAKLACRDALGELGFRIKEGEKDTGPVTETVYRVIGSQGISSGTVGRYARILIEDAQGTCVVRVLVQSKAESRENAQIDPLIAEDLHKRIAARLGK